MKTINTYLIERLKLNQDSKIKQSKINQLGYDESILDVNIKDFDHLKEVLKEYFKPYSKEGYMLNIPKTCRKTKLSYSGYNVSVDKVFVIEFCRAGKGPISKIFVGLSGTDIVMQKHVKNWNTKNSFNECGIVGKFDTLKIGDNLLDWLNKTKKRTINKEPGREINLMETFFGKIN